MRLLFFTIALLGFYLPANSLADVEVRVPFCDFRSVQINGQPCTAYIAITREISNGDFLEVKKITRSGFISEKIKARFRISKTIILQSFGGQVDEAIKIGRFVRENGMYTVVPNNETCESACALIWIAGVYRSLVGDEVLGLHRPWLPHQFYDELSWGDKNRFYSSVSEDIFAYLDAIGVSRAFGETMMEIDSTSMVFYDAYDLGDYFGINAMSAPFEEALVAQYIALGLDFSSYQRSIDPYSGTVSHWRPGMEGWEDIFKSPDSHFFALE